MPQFRSCCFCFQLKDRNCTSELCPGKFQYLFVTLKERIYRTFELSKTLRTQLIGDVSSVSVSPFAHLSVSVCLLVSFPFPTDTALGGSFFLFPLLVFFSHKKILLLFPCTSNNFSRQFISNRFFFLLFLLLFTIFYNRENNNNSKKRIFFILYLLPQWRIWKFFFFEFHKAELCGSITVNSINCHCYLISTNG